MVAQWCTSLLQAYSSVQLASTHGSAASRWAAGSQAEAEEEAAAAKQLSALLLLYLNLAQCIERDNEEELMDVRAVHDAHFILHNACTMPV